MKQIFIPNISYNKEKLSTFKKHTKHFILGLSSIGSYYIDMHKIMKINENVKKSYCIQNMYINEIKQEYHTISYLPMDVIYLQIMRETYESDNIRLCIEYFSHNFAQDQLNHQDEKLIWLEMDHHDCIQDDDTIYNQISSFLSNINV